MKTLAAVLVARDAPLELLELEVPALRPGQVLVEIAYSGVCHTQLLEARGRRGPDAFLPHCLGHEGSGVVREVGPSVSRARVGDHVVLSWIKGLGADVPGVTYQHRGRTINAGGVTTFQQWAVVSENRLTALVDDVALREAAMLGCAVPTGVGAVWHTAQAQPGQSIAVFGVGGVGLCAVAGAAARGCSPIIAVDRNVDRLAVARTLGATHTIDASSVEVLDGIRNLCRDGVDIAIEATGRPEVMTQALCAVRPRGGAAVIVGNASHGQTIAVDPRQLNMGKRLLGTWGGDSDPDRDYATYAAMITRGELRLDPILSEDYALAQINDALSDLETGRVIRPVIAMSTGNGQASRGATTQRHEFIAR